MSVVIGYALERANDDDEIASAAMLWDFKELLVRHLVNRPATAPVEHKAA